MGVSERLGLADLESPLGHAARRAWQRWIGTGDLPAVVAELQDLRAWSRTATAEDADDLLVRLAALTAYDIDAVTVLVWLLLPGARRIAAELTDLDPDIDDLVVGQLWIEATEAHRIPGRVAAAILARTRREVLAELGVGDLARRRDAVWVDAVHVDVAEDLSCVVDWYESADELVDRVEVLMMDAMDANAIHVFDAWLLQTLAAHAARQDAAAKRGRLGLTTPAVIEELADMVHLSPRAIRRRATTALDRLAEYVEARHSRKRLAVWRAQHTSCPVTPAEEMQFALIDDRDAHFFRVRDLPPDAWAPDVDPARRPGIRP